MKLVEDRKTILRCYEGFKKFIDELEQNIVSRDADDNGEVL
jgi:hypothetical protein